jgi:hypothetical protein
LHPPNERDKQVQIAYPAFRLDRACVVRGCYSEYVNVLLEKPTIPSHPGLCQDCVHARRIESDRGSVFFLCRLALTDGRFKKYPRLPVLTCSGYERNITPSL